LLASRAPHIGVTIFYKKSAVHIHKWKAGRIRDQDQIFNRDFQNASKLNETDASQLNSVTQNEPDCADPVEVVTWPSTTAFVTAINWPGVTVRNSTQFGGR
jgi:hypothetical protein